MGRKRTPLSLTPRDVKTLINQGHAVKQNPRRADSPADVTAGALGRATHGGEVIWLPLPAALLDGRGRERQPLPGWRHPDKPPLEDTQTHQGPAPRHNRGGEELPETTPPD